MNKDFLTKLTSTQCNLTTSYHPASNYVRAYKTQLQAGIGCDTNLSSEAGEEVHLVVVKAPSSSSSPSSYLSNRPHDQLHVHHYNDHRGGRRTVRLTVLTRQRGKHQQYQDAPGPLYNVSNRPIKFILVASGPVRWHVNVQGIPTAKEKHLFIISKDSNIKFSRKRTRLLAKSRKRDLPLWSDSQDLLAWTKRRFGAITSRSEISSDDVKLFVGRDNNSPNAQCSDDRMSKSGRVFSTYGMPQPVHGCVALGYTSYVDAQTFLIELLQAPKVLTTITLEILKAQPAITTRDGTTNINDCRDRKMINIVIKSPIDKTKDNVKWMLKSGDTNEECNLNVVSNVRVNINAVKTEVAIRFEELNVTGQDLLHWTHNFVGPVQIYAVVKDVDTILINKPPREKVKSGGQLKNGAVGVNGKKPRWPSVDGGSESNVGTGARTNGLDSVKDQDRRKLYRMIQTRCNRDHLEVAISRELLTILHVDKSKISLRDLNCGVNDETSEFVIIRSGVDECGTHLSPFNGVTSYSNEVQIRTPPELVNTLLQGELGSGWIEGEQGSGTRGDGETGGDGDSNDNGEYPDDDEDYRDAKISIECQAPEIKKPSRVSVNRGQGQHDGSITRCNMSVYDSMSYFLPLTHFPVSVTKDSYLHIKASLIGQDKTLIVDKCWLSTSNRPQDSSAFTKDIITHGCHHETSLEWMDETDAPTGMDVPEVKFRFRLDKDFLGRPAIYLHCQFHACHRDSFVGAHKCSIDPAERCKKAPMPLIPMPVACGPLFVGPLKLRNLDTAVHNNGEDPEMVNEDEASHGLSGQQRIIIEGLDSPTVVGIAFASFIIGILLVGALWFIHSHTGMVKEGSSTIRPRSEINAGGNITPNSSSPMTA